MSANLTRRTVLAITAAAGTFGAARARTATIPNLDVAAIDAAARTAIEIGACPGIAVGVTRNGGMLLARGYGLANLETSTPVASASVFRIGSLTKQFTAALILKLASQGRLGLDDAAAKHLPVFARARPFTLRQLLNQTAGLHSDESEAPPPSGANEPNSQLKITADIAGQTQLFDFEPGAAWLYSNANYIVLGAVVEAVTGAPLADAAAAMIFRPLELSDTAFDTAAAVVPRRADGYTPVEARPGSFTHAAFIEVSDAGGAGAMRSTVGDLCRWHRALFSGRLFGRRFIDIMIAPGRLTDGRLSGANRFSPDDAHYGPVQYAMGLLVDPSAARRSVLHYGAVDGFAACLETYLDEGLTVAVLCNGDMGPEMPFGPIRKAVRMAR